MTNCLAAFRIYVLDSYGCELDRLTTSSFLVDTVLAAYGKYLFEKGSARYLYVYTVTAIQDRFPYLRRSLPASWKVDGKWQAQEPGECREVIPLALLKAMISLALLWRWNIFAGCLMMGFSAMLHPSEFLTASRRHLMLPKDMFIKMMHAYLHIPNPKTKRFARRQHAKIDENVVVAFLTFVFGQLDPGQPLWPASSAVFRKRWDVLLERLGVPTKTAQKGVTPGSLRGSGATHFYLDCEDIPRIAWRGRWSQVKTLEFYLQEVAAQVIFHRLPATSQTIIATLAEACDSLVYAVIQGVL